MPYMAARAQMYSGEANLNEIANAVSISIVPIIGNGDVHDAASYKRMKETGCDGVMIAELQWEFILSFARSERNCRAECIT
jgi:tRNA-dihydrouridine synthase